MSKITGIKSVDFKVKAIGHGVVNWNSATKLRNGEILLNNHMMPKLRGYTSLNGQASENGTPFSKDVRDIDFTKTPLYISQNCIRHHLFKAQSHDIHFSKNNNILDLITSPVGLLRGFVVPGQCQKTSPLLIEDFVDQLGNGNYEQFITNSVNTLEAGKKGQEDAYQKPSNSIFSKTTFGDTEYIAYGSISIEELQFISLDQKFDRCAMKIKKGQGPEVALAIAEYIASLNTDKTLNPTATFHENYVRLGSVYNEGQIGVLLNEDAIEVLVNEMLSKIENLGIKQSKSYMYVDELEVDYNSSNKCMRIKKNINSISENKDEQYAIYFEGK